MRYKILKRIQNGQSTVGYQLISEDGKTLNIPKDQVIQAAYRGSIVNAIYSKHTKSLSGTNNTDLRSLPVIQYADIVKSKNTKSDTNGIKSQAQVEVINNTRKAEKSNRKLAEEFLDKQRRSGINILELRIISEDDVQLVKVNNVPGITRVVIPKFITSYAYTDRYNNIAIVYNIEEKQLEIHSQSGIIVITKEIIESNPYISSIIKNALEECNRTFRLNRLPNISYSNPIVNTYGALANIVSYIADGYSNDDNEFEYLTQSIYSKDDCRLGYIVNEVIKNHSHKSNNYSNDFSIHYNTNCPDSEELYGPFYGTQYTEIEVRAKLTNYDMLFSGIMSKELRILVTEEVKTTSCMSIFKGSENLEHLETHGLILNGDMDRAFYMCKNLETIDFDALGLKGRTVKGNLMFYGCKKLRNFDMSYDNMAFNKAFIGKCDNINIKEIALDLDILNINDLADRFVDTTVGQVIIKCTHRVSLLNTFANSNIKEVKFIGSNGKSPVIILMISAFSGGHFEVIDFGESKCNFNMCTALGAFNNTQANVIDMRNFVYHTTSADLNTESVDRLDDIHTNCIDSIFMQKGKEDNNINTIITRSIQLAAEYLLINGKYHTEHSLYSDLHRNKVIVIDRNTHETCKEILDSISGNIGYDFVKYCGKTYARRASKVGNGTFDINVENGIIGDCSPLNAAYQWYGISRNTIIEAYLAGGDTLDYTVNIHGSVGDAYGLCSNVCIDTYYFEFEDEGNDLNNIYINIDEPSSVKSAFGLVQLVISDEGEFKSTDIIAENIINRVHIDYDRLSHLGTKEQLIRKGIIQIIGLIDIGNNEKSVAVYNVYGERLNIDEGIIHTVYDTYENMIKSVDYKDN